MKKMLFILNPCAGQRRANRYLTEILSVFNRGGYEVIAHITQTRGDCTRIVEASASKVDTVVCAGGDGTFNEMITGILRSGADVSVGYIPCGSTNDFASSLRLPTDVVKAAEAIINGTPHPFDVGQFNQRYFSYVASFGAFTRASYATPQNVKNALGHVAYVLEGIQELTQLRTLHVRFELENRVVEDDFLFGAISNSTSVGGILTLDPKQVDMSDGKFELLLVRAPKDLAELHECILAVQKQQYNCAMITFVSTPSLRVISDPDMPWTLDGERADGQASIEVKNLQHAIRLLK